MKKTIKFLSTIILVAAISFSTALANGEQGNGTKADGEQGNGTGYCGEQGNGTKACDDGGGFADRPSSGITRKSLDNSKNVQQGGLLDYFRNFLVKIFG